MNRALRAAVCLFASPFPIFSANPIPRRCPGYVRDATSSGVPAAVIAKNDNTGAERRAVATRAAIT